MISYKVIGDTVSRRCDLGMNSLKLVHVERGRYNPVTNYSTKIPGR